MWSRIASPRPRQRAGGGGGGGGTSPGRRNSATSSIGGRPGSIKARDYDRGSSPATGSRSTSIRDRRMQASRGYCDAGDDVEWGGDEGGGGYGGMEWMEDNPREVIKVAAGGGVGAAARGDTARLIADEEEGNYNEEEEEEIEEEGEEEGEKEGEGEVIASSDSFTSSHLSSVLGAGDRANRITIVTGGGQAPPPPPTPAYQPVPMTTTTTVAGGGAGAGTTSSAANTTLPRLIPTRYRIRDFLLGDFSFNDDGERYVDCVIILVVELILRIVNGGSFVRSEWALSESGCYVDKLCYAGS